MQGIVIGLMILLIKSRFSFTGCTCTIPAKMVCEYSAIEHTLKTELLSSLLSQQADEFRLFTNPVTGTI